MPRRRAHELVRTWIIAPTGNISRSLECAAPSILTWKRPSRVASRQTLVGLSLRNFPLYVAQSVLQAAREFLLTTPMCE